MVAFPSPTLDALRGFRTRPFPWAPSQVSTDAMALRDEKFKAYNTPPVKPTAPYDPHCLDHQTEGMKTGAREPYVVSIEGNKSFLQRCQEAWIFFALVVWLMWVIQVLAVWWWIFRQVFIFLFRGMVAPWLLGRLFLLWLVV